MKPLLKRLAAGLFLAILSSAAAAQTSAAPPLDAYGALPSLELVDLSPSGDRLAFITVIGEERTLALVDMKSRRTIRRVRVADAKVRALEWVGEDQVLITASTTRTLFGFGPDQHELYLGQIYDLASGRLSNVLRDDTDLLPFMVDTPQIRTTPTGPAVFLRGVDAEKPGERNLYRVEPANQRLTRAERMSAEVEDLVLDPTGRSVARSTYDDRSKIWSLRLRDGDDFRIAWSTAAQVDLPSLMGLGIAGSSVIVAADRPDLTVNGREAQYFDVNLDTGAWRPVRFEFPITAPLFHPATQRMIGAYATGDEGERYVFADQAAGDLWQAVQTAFPDQAPTLISWSDDLRTVVVFTSGDGDSGEYHYLNLDDNTLSTVGRAYPAVPDDQVGPVKAVTYAAADGTEIHAYLTLPAGRANATGLPLVVLPHGGPAARDEMGFDWWAQAIASRGYAVLQPNFRGSTGYGRDFLEAGYGEWGRKMQTDLSDGVRWLAGQGTIDPKRVCIVGGSYGGYAALAGPTLDPGVYRCAVSVAGVSDLRRMVEGEASRGARRDNGSVRYWNRFMGAERLGDRSLDERSPARLADRADAPILLIHGRDDTVVPIEQSRVMAAALRRAGKPVEMIELDGEDHWLSMGRTRTRMLTETLRFLQANNPAE